MRGKRRSGLKASATFKNEESRSEERLDGEGFGLGFVFGFGGGIWEWGVF
jgi:hypothetical protein